MSFQRLIKSLFFSNVFYGICVIGLSLETPFRQQIPLNDTHFYVFLFCVSTLYYIKAYTKQHQPSNFSSERSIWYYSNKRKIIFFQILLMIIIGNSIFYWITHNSLSWSAIKLKTWLYISIFPILALLYNGIEISKKRSIALRNLGLLKPFLISFIWAGTVSILPIFYYDITHVSNRIFTSTTTYLLFENWLYISVLCILFDIKDYASDHNFQLKTFAVRFGLRKLINKIIIPMSILGWFFFIAVSILDHSKPLSIIFNSIPYILLIIVSHSMYQRKTILYYLAIIDGLMLVKAIFGITSMTLIK